MAQTEAHISSESPSTQEVDAQLIVGGLFQRMIDRTADAIRNIDSPRGNNRQV